jgi:hypothetical protein
VTAFFEATRRSTTWAQLDWSEPTRRALVAAE